MVKDMNLDTTIRICETIREDNGLAKSSRNTYLSEHQKEDAAVIYKSLQRAKEIVSANEFADTEAVKKEVKDMIETNAVGSSVQYIAITDNELLNSIEDLKAYEGEVLISLAVYFGKTRLIDNIIFIKKKGK
jgi:pantoate--beta-alanine ligase